ncbi:MAG: 30S ribosomal protein S1 [Firmicutes bacterium ADurb.Bin193]|nr:MAG: 30S ribosomal protein S1 [Firmicutes bacterium ADurb.Bin193]
MEFKDLNLSEMDKNLTEPEREEWQAIYASYRSASVISGGVAGVDLHEFKIVPKGKKKAVSQTVRCLIVIKYRIKIIIPESEVFLEDFNSGYHILHSMCGAQVDYVITYIDREAGFAVASRKLALEKMQAATARQRLKEGQMIDVKIISVGRNVCTVNYGGYDIMLPQRDVSYSIVPDLRETIHPGEIKKAVIKEYDKDEKILKISIKETTAHPFDGIETRHPLKSTRIATIVGKYGGGVFCRLYDNITDVLCSYDPMQYDGDYKIGNTVEIIISKYNFERKLVYGKILRKMH